MSLPYEILIRSKEGALQGAHAIDEPGDLARPLTESDLASFGPDVNAALLSVIAVKDAEIHALRNPVSPATLAYLALPDEIQDAFRSSYETAALLVDAGRRDLAIAHIQALTIPAELESTRSEIISLIQQG